MRMKKYLIASFMFLSSITVFAQVDKSSSLFQTIMLKDSLLFNVGFNTCNIVQFEKLISENFEFYHDVSGISEKLSFIDGIKKGLCSNPTNYQSRRELLTESTQIFALYDKGKLYGALQEGVHQFFEKIPNEPEKFGSSARFTHVWLLENNDWKLARAFSYEHVKKQLPTSGLSSLNDRK